MLPLFSVIIPTCNRPEELAACLEGLAPSVQSVGEASYEVIVTDDGRRLPAQHLVANRFPWVRWTAGPAMGPASNRNHGASCANGQWLVFVDDDCLPDPQLLRAYHEVATFETSHEMVCLEGPTLRIGVPSSLLWEAPHNPSGGACISANFAIPKITFEQSGKFDEHFPTAAFEDTEFFNRFGLKGGTIKFVSNAIVRHPLRRVSSARKLANRWEGKAILSRYQGASCGTIMWRLPWHVLRVIQSRFRGQPWNRDNRDAAWLFFKEWLIVVWKTPGWVWKLSRMSRNDFWVTQVAKSGPPARFGF